MYYECKNAECKKNARNLPIYFQKSITCFEMIVLDWSMNNRKDEPHRKK